MTRIANIAQHTRILDAIFDTQQRLFDRQTQISSGKKAQAFSGLAADTRRLVSLEGARARAQEFVDNNKLIDSRLNLTDSTLSSIFDIATRLKTLLMQRLNAASGNAGALSVEAQQMLDSVAGLLNTELNGRYLFAGSRTDTPPVITPVPDPTTFGVADATYYQGDSVALSARVSDSVSVTYGITADRQGFQDLIGALKATIEGDNTNDQTLLQSGLTLVSKAIDAVASYRNEVGSALNIVDAASERHQSFVTYADGIINEIENVDVTSAITRLSADQVALQASYMTVARLGTLSLAQFLR